MMERVLIFGLRAGLGDIQLISTQPRTQRTSRSMLDKDISKIIKDEISEMQDWIPFSSALGACGIHASRATNYQVEQVAETVKSDEVSIPNRL